MDNLKDIQDWNEDHELKKLGIAYAEATAEYLNLEKKVATPAPAPTNGMYRVFNKDGKQVGAYSMESNAFNHVKQLLASDGSAKITLKDK